MPFVDFASPPTGLPAEMRARVTATIAALPNMTRTGLAEGERAGGMVTTVKPERAWEASIHPHRFIHLSYYSKHSGEGESAMDRDIARAQVPWFRDGRRQAAWDRTRRFERTSAGLFGSIRVDVHTEVGRSASTTRRKAHRRRRRRSVGKWYTPLMHLSKFTGGYDVQLKPHVPLSRTMPSLVEILY